MPSAERVLEDMSELALRGTELGAPGFLPRDPAVLRSILTAHNLQLVGAFVALVLHERRIDEARAEALRVADLLVDVGGDVLALAVVPGADWTGPRELGDRDWLHLADNVGEIRSALAARGVTLALHPHYGTLVQTAEQIERALELIDVGWCLDTGHLVLAGLDPAEFAREYGDRVAHVHLKDVDASLAAELRAGVGTLLSATRRGLFLPLGRGGARIGAVLAALEQHAYDRWLVLEQDTAITADQPELGSGPILDAKHSIAFLHDSTRDRL